MKPHRTARFYFLKFKRLRGDAASLARGVALGVFIGITPTIPMHTVSILLLSFPFRASKISALLASVMVSNPLTFFPTYYFSWLIGDRFLPGILTWEKIDSIMILIDTKAGFTIIITELSKLGIDALTVLLLGGCVLATPFAIVGYFLSLKFFKVIEEKRIKRRALKESE
ncbi:MAG: DUF2062 domain-containing protein [Desulfobulbaceae bacterium]|nr:DUF2062 domain-containing protein [Desulfobulbaceae bacterium]